MFQASMGSNLTRSHFCNLYCVTALRQGAALRKWSMSGRMERTSATETVDSGSITHCFKPKTIKIAIFSFPARRSAVKETV